MGEESSISEYSINPRNPIVLVPFGGVIFPLERGNQRRGWRRPIDNDEQRLYLISTLACEGEQRQWGDG